MTDDRTLERAARSWLEEGPTRAPDRAVDAALSRIQTTRQERDLRIPWRMPTMFTNRVAIAALAIVLLVAGAGLAITRLPGIGPGGPGPAPSPTPSSAPLAAITASDVGNVLPAGTYRVSGFAAPFTVTLPAGWNATEFTPNSIGLALKSNGSVNVYMAVMNKVYPDPCHAGPGAQVVGPTVDALVAALSSMPGFQVTNVGPATVGGATGKAFTITNSIDVATAKCSGSTLPFGTYDRNGTDVDIAMFGGETDEFWALDVGGTRVFMAVTDNALAVTQQVRDSLSFAVVPG